MTAPVTLPPPPRCLDCRNCDARTVGGQQRLMCRDGHLLHPECAWFLLRRPSIAVERRRM
jgi:hypothetical protein